MKLKEKRIFAALVVAIMLMASVIPFASYEGDAEVGDDGYYSYTLNYDSSKMSVSGGTPLSVDGVNAIYHPSYDAVNDTTTGYGSWTWDKNTGLGPFNSFYAAFDLNDNNKMVARLNPFDLTKTLNGDTLGSGSYTSKYNIMWVLPTVYSKETANSITFSNQYFEGSSAYAHTINGHIYNYIAYGVYEGNIDTTIIDGNETYVYTSQSSNIYGSELKPTVSHTRATFRDNANNYNMDSSLSDGVNDAYSMLWNFPQWQLYRNLSFTVMESFNSQETIGYGLTFNNQIQKNGLADSLGPYCGTRSSSASTVSKLFLENTWGNIWESVDGVVISYSPIDGSSLKSATFWIDLNAVPTDATSPGNNIYSSTLTNVQPSGYMAGNILTDGMLWGYPFGPGGSASSGTTDYMNVGTVDSTVDRIPLSGGYILSSFSTMTQDGISYVDTINSSSLSYQTVGSRLAFVFDNDTTLTTVSIESEDTDMGIVDVASIPGVTVGSLITVNGNILTIGSESVTASVNDPTAQYSYTFTGWYDSSDNPITNSTRVTKNMQIVAKFTASINSYTITWNIEGQISTEVYQYGQTPTHADPTKDYYTFTGWNPAIVPVTGNATYTAMFTPIIYTVTWDAGEGTVTPTVSYGSAETPIVPPTPEREGYEFKGWYTDPDEGTELPSPFYPTSNVTYYAHWKLSENPIDFTKIVDAVPILIVLGIFLGALAMFTSSNGWGYALSNITPYGIVVGIVAVGIALVLAYFFIFPLLGNL